MKYGFGVDLGGTTVKLAFFNTEGTMLHKWEIPTNTAEGGKYILPDIAAAVLGYLNEENIPQDQIIGIGIGVPGPVGDDGTVNKCVNLGWGVMNIKNELEALTGFKVRAGNDANVAAMGEYWKGGGLGSKSMILATLGTGVGGGIIIDGKLLYGVHGAGGEIGHMVMNRDETEACGCGKYGCAEQYCSATGVVRLAKRTLNDCDTPSLLRNKDITCKDVFDAATAGDKVAKAALDRVYRYLGEFVGNLCCVINPDTVVFGGGVSKAGTQLLEGMRPYFLKYVFHACSNVHFALATLGNDAGAYGAFKLVLDETT